MIPALRVPNRMGARLWPAARPGSANRQGRFGIGLSRPIFQIGLLRPLWPQAARGPRSRLALWILPALFFSLIGISATQAAPQSPDSEAVALAPVPTPKRGFRTFLPKAGEAIDDPASQVVQLLLDRQDKGDFDSYMVQVLFRGKPSQRSVRTLPDRVEIDFFDTGKPATRIAKIRGGAVEACSIEELFYKDVAVKSGGAP